MSKTVKLSGRNVKRCFRGTFPSLEFPATCPVAMVTMSGCTLRLRKRENIVIIYFVQASVLKMMSGSTVDVKQLIQAQTVKVKNIFENIKTQKAVKPSQAKTSNICCFNLLKCDDL